MCSCCGSYCEPRHLGDEWGMCDRCRHGGCQGAPWNGEGAIERRSGCPLLAAATQPQTHTDPPTDPEPTPDVAPGPARDSTRWGHHLRPAFRDADLDRVIEELRQHPLVRVAGGDRELAARVLESFKVLRGEVAAAHGRLGRIRSIIEKARDRAESIEPGDVKRAIEHGDFRLLWKLASGEDSSS